MKTKLAVALWIVCGGFADVHGEDTRPLTWADYHPDLARTFARSRVPWKSRAVLTRFPASQPVVVRGPGEELIANSHNTLVHSTDGGLNWRRLGEVPVDSSVPSGFKLLAVNMDGCGVTERGTILFHYTKQFNAGEAYDSYAATFHAECYIVRSTDRGKSWQPPVRLASKGFNCVGTGRARFVRLPGGVIGLPMETWNAARSGRPVPDSQKWFQAFLYLSSDDGRTWTRSGSLGPHSCEADLLPLPGGRLLASVRYQRKKLPADPARLAAPIWFDPDHRRDTCAECRKAGAFGVGGHSVFKQTAVVASKDGGRTWSRPKLITGWLQQTGCLVRLSNGTIVLPFGHKTTAMGRRFGQRFLVSYDDGNSWTRTVYELHHGGLYANSVALDDDTIVTVHDNRDAGDRNLQVLRWKAPSRAVASQGGFFKPRQVEATK